MEKHEKEPESEEEKESEFSDLVSGTLNFLGLKMDVGELLSSPESARDRLQDLREKLKAAGGKEGLSDDEWRQGGSTITGHIRTRGLLGEREFHVGTMGKPGRKATGRPSPEPPEVVEPPVDIFDEGEQVTIVADVPGVALEDLELNVEGRVFSLATKATAPRSYRKELRLESDVQADSLEATCRNGALEVRVRKQGTGKNQGPNS